MANYIEFRVHLKEGAGIETITTLAEHFQMYLTDEITYLADAGEPEGEICTQDVTYEIKMGMEGK